MKHLLSTTILLTILLGISCHKDNGPCLTCPPPYTQSILLDTLSIESAAVVFQVSTMDSTHLGAVQLYRDSVSVFSKTILSIDTTIIDTVLLPAHHYRYKAFRLTGNTPIDSSAAIVLTTMDTTSHNFTWEIDTLGDGNSSVLNDVAIVNDTLTYAVGEIYKQDSSGLFETAPYGVAVWNGRTWQLEQLHAPGPTPGSAASILAPLRGLFAFSPTDVWLAGGGVFHWNGQSQTVTPYWINSFPGNPNPILWGGAVKLWGTSSTDLYAVATAGGIAHYDGHAWQEIYSGTTLDIQDIWGSRNQKTGEWEILAVAGNYYVNNERKILQITGTTATALSDSGINWALNGLWFSPGKQYWVVGTGLWEKRPNINALRWNGGPNVITTYTTNRIRGTEINDIFFCGAYGDLFHFNGVSWHSYRSETNLSSGQYVSIAVSGNEVFAVGEDNPRAVVARGKRN